MGTIESRKSEVGSRKLRVEGRKGEPAARGLPPVFLALLLAVPRMLAAHDPGLSTLAIEVGTEEVSAILLLDRADLEAPPAAPAGALEVSFDGRPARPERIDTARAETGALRLSFGFRRPAAARLRVRSAILAQLPRGHRQWVSVHGDDGRVIFERLRHAGDPEFEVDLGGGAAASPERTFSGFLALGAEHVFSGYDHLAFLLGLLLAG